MKHYSTHEIENKIKQILNDHPDNYSEFEVNVSADFSFTGCSYQIDISDMYNSPKLGFRELSKIADFFATENVDIHDDYGYEGCETCGYGGKHGKVIRVWENK